MHPLQEQLYGVIEHCVRQSSAVLLEIVMRGERGRRVFEVFIDAEEPVTADICSEISRRITDQIDSTKVITGSYRMDVSSPGIDRPLKFLWQYKKHVGRTFRVKFRAADAPQEHRGKLLEVQGEAVLLSAGDEASTVRLPFADIIEAKVLPPW